MDAFSIYCKQAFVNSRMSLEELAVLSCVNKHLQQSLQMMYGSGTEQHVDKCALKSLEQIGISFTSQQDYVFNYVELVKFIVPFRRYQMLSMKSHKYQQALHKLLLHFTKRGKKTIFMEYKEIPFKKQTRTLSIMLRFIQKEENTAVKLIFVYIMYSFILGLLQNNPTEFICNRDVSMFGFRKLRKSIVHSTNTLTQQIRENSVFMPFTFLEKLVRLLAQTRRIVSGI